MSPSNSGFQGFVEPEPTPAQVIAGLRATVEDNPVQLLTPEGERVADPQWDRWIADIDGVPDGPAGRAADGGAGREAGGLEGGGREGASGVDALCGLYRDMVLVRRADREANALQRQGQLGIWVPLLGQEAAQIGAGRALRADDMAFPSYREHGVAWCRGIDPTDLLGIFRGTDHGSWDPIATRFHLYTIVIGNQCLNATGYAMGQRFDGKVGGSGDSGEAGQATICFFGDGATSQGDVHEGFVWSAVYDAPVVFFCQNNQWAISEPLERQTRVPLYQRARGYGFPGIRVDGNDVLATLAVTRWALEECRTGNGPVLIEAFTYRMDAHTTSDDPSRYRLADELELWKLKDPIERLRVNLVRQHQVGQDFFDGIQAESDALAARLREFCVNMPKPGPERIFSEVYAELSPPLRAQRDEYLSYHGSFTDGS